MQGVTRAASGQPFQIHRPTLIRPPADDDQSFPLISEGWREEARVPSVPGSTYNARWWRTVLAVWTVLGVTAALQQAGMYAMRGELQRQWLLVLWQIPRWLLWAAFTPLIFEAYRRFPLTRGRVRSSLLVQLTLAVLVTVVAEGTHAQMSIVVEKITGAVVDPSRPPGLGFAAISILTRLVLDLVTYAAVVGVAIALDSQRRLRERDTRAAQLEADLARAQVQAIKMQVQPHFLFNTLHAINVLIHEEPSVASHMVTQLGDLLRHTLSRATVAEVPLKAELDVLALYLAIERVRFKDRLTVVFDVPPETMSALVPELVLQPLAENAIKHGIGSSTGTVLVRIRASRAGAVLTLEVTDTGAGPSDGGTPRERVGLSTVRARLERLYGGGQSLTVERAPGGGCVSRITLPFLEAPAVV